MADLLDIMDVDNLDEAALMAEIARVEQEIQEAPAVEINEFDEFESKLNTMNPLEIQEQIAKIRSQLNLQQELSTEGKGKRKKGKPPVRTGRHDGVRGGLGVDGKSQLYCYCKQPENPTLPMIGCDVCDNWFHLVCVGLSWGEADCVEKFVCLLCQRKNRHKRVTYVSPLQLEAKLQREVSRLYTKDQVEKEIRRVQDLLEENEHETQHALTGQSLDTDWAGSSGDNQDRGMACFWCGHTFYYACLLND